MTPPSTVTKSRVDWALYDESRLGVCVELLLACLEAYGSDYGALGIQSVTDFVTTLRNQCDEMSRLRTFPEPPHIQRLRPVYARNPLNLLILAASARAPSKSSALSS